MSKNITKILPVLFGFFVMGFCDVVGISTSYVKADFNLSETVAGFIPTMVFLWFLLFSVPAAICMNKYGRKTMVQVANVITFIGMMIPFINYSLVSCLVAFALLGIGNTIIQVSLNPLMTNVVKGEALTSSLTAGQVVKAVCAFCAPFIAAFAANSLGSWKFLFPIFAGITLLSALWLAFTKIPREEVVSQSSSVKDTFGLLKDGKILLLFLGIFFVVGIDVGTNTLAPKLMMERAGWAVDQAGKAASCYFICRTVGALLGAVLLAKLNEVIYFRANILVAALAVALLFFVNGTVPMLVLIGCIGFFCSSIFSLIFSAAMKARPEKANEISGLMIVGVFGGAVIPPLMGVLADAVGNQCGSLIAIALCAAYLVFCSFYIKKQA